MRIHVKPLSVNEVFQGRRFKNKKYKSYELELMYMLPSVKIQFKGRLKVDITFGFSSALADIDNPLKPLIDVLQKKYGFNDKQIFKLNVEKEIVKRGQEYIDLNIEEIK